MHIYDKIMWNISSSRRL